MCSPECKRLCFLAFRTIWLIQTNSSTSTLIVRIRTVHAVHTTVLLILNTVHCKKKRGKRCDHEFPDRSTCLLHIALQLYTWSIE